MNDETREQLKPCPFCGNNKPFVERMETYSYAVRCNKCLATGEWSDEDCVKQQKDHEVEAIHKWNTRADSTKTCCKCKEKLSVDEFHKDTQSSDGLKSSCKKCKALDTVEYRRTKTGLASKIYNNQTTDAKRRGHTPPNYAKAEFTEWLLDHNAFEEMYKNWVESGYAKKLVPSPDRTSINKSYTFDNLQLLTWQRNHAKGNVDKGDSVVGTNTKTGEKVEFKSMRQASKFAGVDSSGISKCCKGSQKTAGGYRWQYKQKEDCDMNKIDQSAEVEEATEAGIIVARRFREERDDALAKARSHELELVDVRSLWHESKAEVERLLNTNANLVDSRASLKLECGSLVTEIDDLKRKLGVARDALDWALGSSGDFKARQDGDGPYWWRGELRKRAGLKWDGEKNVEEREAQGG